LYYYFILYYLIFIIYISFLTSLKNNSLVLPGHTFIQSLNRASVTERNWFESLLNHIIFPNRG